MVRNMILQEAVEKKSAADTAVTSIKKLLNTTKLTKFKSTDSCSKFYNAFFMCCPSWASYRSQKNELISQSKTYK